MFYGALARTMGRLSRVNESAWGRWLFRVSCSVNLLPLLCAQIPLTDVLAVFRLADLSLYAGALGSFFLIRLLWSYQMVFMLTPFRLSIGVLVFFKIHLISSFYSLFLPGNMLASGIASWYKLTHALGRGSRAFALLLHFRFVNTLTLFGIGWIGTCYDPQLSFTGMQVLGATLCLGLLLAGVVMFSTKLTVRMEGWGGALAEHLPVPDWVHNWAQTIWRALTSFQQLPIQTVFLVLSLSVLSQGLSILNMYLLALALGVPIPFFALCWIRAFLDVLLYLPFSIAGLGLREMSLVFLLGTYGIAEAQALSFSLAFFSLVVVGGLFGGVWEGWEWCVGQGRPKGDVTSHNFPQSQGHCERTPSPA